MNAIIKCLVIEDDEITRVKVERIIGDQFHLEYATSIAQATDKLLESGFDCALVDYRLPDGTGLDILKKLAQRKIPSIFITSQSSEEIAVAALKAGAEDYVVKGSPLFNELKYPIKRAIAIHRRREESLRAELDRERLLDKYREALKRVDILEGLLPVCPSCKSVRDDGYWRTVESYLLSRTNLEVKHGMCTKCFGKEMARVDAE